MALKGLPRLFLGKEVLVKIDRPLGAKHPVWDFNYPIHYGYVPGVMAPDGEELDAYILGESQPLQAFRGICIAIIHRLDDADDKLVLAAPGVQYSDAAIRALTDFQEQYFTSVIIRE